LERYIANLFAIAVLLAHIFQIMTHMPQLLVIAGELLASDPSTGNRKTICITTDLLLSVPAKCVPKVQCLKKQPNRQVVAK
jgi:uncharacterized protein YhhL (DUF1145 family)